MSLNSLNLIKIYFRCLFYLFFSLFFFGDTPTSNHILYGFTPGSIFSTDQPAMNLLNVFDILAKAHIVIGKRGKFCLATFQQRPFLRSCCQFSIICRECDILHTKGTHLFPIGKESYVFHPLPHIVTSRCVFRMGLYPSPEKQGTGTFSPRLGYRTDSI